MAALPGHHGGAGPKPRCFLAETRERQRARSVTWEGGAASLRDDYRLGTWREEGASCFL